MCESRIVEDGVYTGLLPRVGDTPSPNSPATAARPSPHEAGIPRFTEPRLVAVAIMVA
ncbi:hypothetical protein K8O92_22005 [Nocardia asteroides]|nr:hypothetical protein K8O92_22005 [Nocardia asteroides]